jgi:thiamine-phosphate pyrophosphorylase
MISDRFRPNGPPAAGAPADRLAARVAVAARAGVHLVQIRERDLDGGPLVRLVRACVQGVRGTPARVIVNDRVDVALAAGAHGVHLRADSMPAARVRALTPAGFLVGRSVHAADEAARVDADGGLDYLVFGTVFASRSKPGQPPSGTGMLAEVVRATRLPVLAVGGVAPANFEAVARTGAAGFAAIGLFADAEDEGVRASVASAQAAFS